jgi:hypothetical protein
MREYRRARGFSRRGCCSGQPRDSSDKPAGWALLVTGRGYRSCQFAGSKDSHLAHTLDVSNPGVKLGGCRDEMTVGDKFETQYRHKRAQFRVAWITARRGASEQQIGAECLEPGKQVWGAPFSQQADEYEEQE